ncbi:hypothetical protein ACFVQB_14410 [Paenibacillus sp. NPDC057886]|uniref:hypothetical protein n=1 Tax=Paenibacillus sp. NPDC057886 TaxID=3346270 RepID=UPI0036B06871
MQLIEMKNEYKQAKMDYRNVNSKIAKKGIGEEIYKLKHKIDEEERRLNSKLKTVDINGVQYEIPKSFNYVPNTDRYTYEVKDDCLYQFKKMRRDPDGSFHSHHYVWIPQAENKYAELCIRTLGGDRFGERYFLRVNYYKHPSDNISYLSKDIRTDNYNYRAYYDYVLAKLGFKHKKDRDHTNYLEWVTDEEAMHV